MRAIDIEPIWRFAIAWLVMIPFIFFAVHGNFPFEASSHPDTSSPLNGSSLAGLANTGRDLGFVGWILIPGVTYLIVGYLIVINARRVLLQTIQMKMLTLLALLTIFSALWSQDPFRSTYNGVFYFVDTLFAFYLVLKFETEEIISIFMMGGTIVAVLSLLLVIFYPQRAVINGAVQAIHPGAWNGMFGDRTSAGKSLVFLLSPAIIFRRQSMSYRQWAYIALLLLMMIKAQAETGRVVTCLYILFMGALALLRRFGRRSSLILGGALFAFGALIAYLGFVYLPLITENLGRNATLTGRTEIWAIVLRSIAKHPVLGYGFYAFWLGMTGESANSILAAHWVFGYAHNGILELWLQLGLVGVALFFITLIQAIVNAWFCFRRGCPPGVEWYVGLIALTIMYNVDEATVVWPNELVSIMYVLACCGLAKAARQIKSARTIKGLDI